MMKGIDRESIGVAIEAIAYERRIKVKMNEKTGDR